MRDFWPLFLILLHCAQISFPCTVLSKKRRVASCKKLPIVTGFLKIGKPWRSAFSKGPKTGRCARHHADFRCAHACISEESDTVIEMGTISTILDLDTRILHVPGSYSCTVQIIDSISYLYIPVGVLHEFEYWKPSRSLNQRGCAEIKTFHFSKPSLSSLSSSASSSPAWPFLPCRLLSSTPRALSYESSGSQASHTGIVDISHRSAHSPLLSLFGGQSAHSTTRPSVLAMNLRATAPRRRNKGSRYSPFALG